MVLVALQPSSWVRSTVLLAVAVGLVLPAPARCASCVVGGSNCSMCKTEGPAATKTAVRTCCQRHAQAEKGVASSLIGCVKVQARTCGCQFSPVERTNAPTERQLMVSDILAALPASLPLIDDAASEVCQATTAFGDLPPPVPHRVLHCSWII